MLSSLSPEVLAYPGRRATLLERSLRHHRGQWLSVPISPPPCAEQKSAA